MRLLDSRVYREDVDRVASSDLEWEKIADTAVVLSGASGMIGSFLVDVLMARNLSHHLNCTIYALARNVTALEDRFREYEGLDNLILTSVDVSAGPLDLHEADYVIHAASNTHPVAYATEPVVTIMTNVQGTHTMLDLAARTHARRAILLSTVEIYGESRGSVEKFTESDLGYIDSNTLRAGYPESKRTSEALCHAFREERGVDVVIPRLPRVFGPTMRLTDTKAISQFLLNAAVGQDIVLKSDGSQLYSYCHVADAVSAILTCLLCGESGQAYNVADPSCDISLGDLAHLIAETAERAVVFDLPGETEQRGFSTTTIAVMDGSKLSRLGWKSFHTIGAGVERTLTVLKEIMA